MPGNNLSALCLPPTCFAPLRAARLLLFFDRLYCYQPAEDAPLPGHPLAKAELLHGYPPAPLGEKLKDFRRLLKDMQDHATEYYQGYLSSLASGAEEEMEAGWRQVARQLKGTVPDHEEKEDALWRARLFLTLAENQAGLQEELAAGIQAITRRETEMLRLLQGEEEELSELSLSSAATAATFPVRSEQLLAAWGLLYLADNRPDRPWLLATADEESAGLLLDEYERAAGRLPEKLLTLDMPPAFATEADVIEKRRNLSLPAHDILGRLEDFLTKAAFAGTDPETAASEQTARDLAAEWQMVSDFANDRIKKPAAENDASGPAPTGVLSFYRLSGISFPALFRLFCRQGKEAARPSSPHAILAVLRES